MVKVQRGEPVLAPHFKVVQEDNFMAKVDAVVEALSVRTNLTGCAFANTPTIAWNKY